MTNTHPALTATDLYDFYGLAVLPAPLEPGALRIAEFRLQELRAAYLEALRSRFANWGKGASGRITLESMISSLRSTLHEEISKQAENMMRTGGSFNMLAAIEKMNTGVLDEKKQQESRDTIKLANGLANFKAADYPTIAKCVITLYEAKEPKQIILAIDTLNDLQHCGGFILVDFIAGVRSPNDPNGQIILKEVLDIKKNAKSPLDFLDKMSSDVKKIVRAHVKK